MTARRSGSSARTALAAATMTLVAASCPSQEPNGTGTWRQLRAASGLLAEGHAAEAEAITVALLQRVPTSGLAWYQLALCRRLQPERHDDARAAALRAAALDPTFADARLLAAELLLSTAPRQARRHALAAGRHAGGDLPTLRQAIAICLACDDMAACRELLGHAKSAAHRDPDLLRLQAEMALVEGRADAALAHYRRITELTPADRLAHESIARLLLALGRDDDAIDALRACLRCNPTDVDLRSELIRLLQRLGRPAAEIRSERICLTYYRRLRARLGTGPSPAARRPQRSR